MQVTRKLRVSIPAGIDDGMQIRLAGEGEHGMRGGPPGNLYVVVSVKKHPLFQREGNDLLMNLPINITQAALGDQIQVPTLNGDVAFTVPPGTQHGQTFRIKDAGVPYLRRNGRGDLIITTQVVVPRKLNEPQKALLRELARTLGKEPLAPKGVLDKMKDAFK
jgi:molecular chaperone DnaJ